MVAYSDTKLKVHECSVHDNVPGARTQSQFRPEKVSHFTAYLQLETTPSPAVSESLSCESAFWRVAVTSESDLCKRMTLALLHLTVCWPQDGNSRADRAERGLRGGQVARDLVAGGRRRGLTSEQSLRDHADGTLCACDRFLDTLHTGGGLSVTTGPQENS